MSFPSREKWDKFLEYVRRGHLRPDALKLAKISQKHTNNLYASAEAGDEEAQELLDEMLRAEAEGADKYLGNIGKLAESGSLKANIEMLKLIRPHRFIQVTQQDIQVTHTDTRPSFLDEGAAKHRIVELALQLAREDDTARQALLGGLESIKPHELEQRKGPVDEATWEVEGGSDASET